MDRPPGLTMTPLTWAMLVTLALLWGCTFFFNAIALPDIPPLSLIALRVGGATLVMWPILLMRGLAVPADRGSLGGLLIMGALNNALPFSLIFWGQTTITSGLASILNATTPLFTVLVAHALTPDERMTVRKLFGVLAGLAGVAILIGPDLGGGIWGQIACLAAALSYAFAGVYGRRFQAMGVAPMQAAAGQVTASTTLILPIMLIVDRPWELAAPPSVVVWAALAGLALLSTALAYVLYFRILAAAGATNLLLVTFLIPVTAILLGAAVLGERLEGRHFAGMTLIGVGLAAIDGRIASLLRAAK